MAGRNKGQEESRGAGIGAMVCAQRGPSRYLCRRFLHNL